MITRFIARVTKKIFTEMREPESYFIGQNTNTLLEWIHFIFVAQIPQKSLLNKHFVATASHRLFSYDNRKPWNVKYQFS